MESFEDLECWKLGAEIRKDVMRLTKSFPVEETLRLTDQMKRCARSVTNNISEGLGRFHYKENIQFCRHSGGSLFELKDHFLIAFDEGYISETQLIEYKQKITANLKVLNGYINYLKRAIDSN